MNLMSFNSNFTPIKTFLQKTGAHRIIKLRQRYFLTRSNHLRIRYVLSGVAAIFFCLGYLSHAALRSSSNTNNNIIVSDMETYEGSGKGTVMVLASLNDVDLSEENQKVENAATKNLQEPLSILVENNTPTPATNNPYKKVLTIGKGDTLSGVLQNAGVSGAESYRAVKAMEKYYDPRDIKPGQNISITLSPSLNETLKLTSLDMKIDVTKTLIVHKNEKEAFEANMEEKEVVLNIKAAKTMINSSLYVAAAHAGVPASLIAELIHLYSYEVDFQRDIRAGDTLELLYETYETKDGALAHYGHLVYANLNVNKTAIPIYRYKDKNNDANYYHDDGKSLKQLLMKTPVDGARMSSGYGMRKHPILGYSKMHKGVDFAAPRGTPIYAAGDGVVERANRFGSYGNYMRIRHNSTYKTAYAHLKNFARSVKTGKRVKQGQVIGYVGTTGRSTGPHLHYEVMKNGKQINPKSVKSTNRMTLTKNSLTAFKAKITGIKAQYIALAQDLKLAQNSADNSTGQSVSE